MKRYALWLVVLLFAVGSGQSVRSDDERGRPLRAKLSGAQEVNSKSTTGKGAFEARVNETDTAVDYKLEWQDLEGATVLQSHIHFGQRGVNGGIMIWLCGSASNPGPAGTPVCPGPLNGTLEGSFSAANVVGPADQGIAATEFAEALKAIRSGLAYVNVHTDKFPGGEIRGQIRGKGFRPFDDVPGQAFGHDHSGRGGNNRD
ncbi:MAG: CHRD domain-containing protein [Acidobacteriota bacterium]